MESWDFPRGPSTPRHQVSSSLCHFHHLYFEVSWVEVLLCLGSECLQAYLGEWAELEHRSLSFLHREKCLKCFINIWCTFSVLWTAMWKFPIIVLVLRVQNQELLHYLLLSRYVSTRYLPGTELDMDTQCESEVARSCPTLCDPMDRRLPGSSIHGIFQARILELVAISFSRRSSRPRDWTRVSHVVGRHFTVWATREIWDLHFITTKGRHGLQWTVACFLINTKTENHSTWKIQTTNSFLPYNTL